MSMPGARQQSLLEQVDHVNARHIAKVQEIVDDAKHGAMLSVGGAGAGLIAGKAVGGALAEGLALVKAHQDIAKAHNAYIENLDRWVGDLRAIPGITVHKGAHGDWWIKIPPTEPGEAEISRHVSGVGDHWPSEAAQSEQHGQATTPHPGTDGRREDGQSNHDRSDKPGSTIKVDDLPRVDSHGRPIPTVNVEDLPRVDSHAQRTAPITADHPAMHKDPHPTDSAAPSHHGHDHDSPGSHGNDHPGEHRDDHPAEHRDGHAAEHRDGHAAEHRDDHAAEHRDDHAAEHRDDHAADRAGHGEHAELAGSSTSDGSGQHGSDHSHGASAPGHAAGGHGGAQGSSSGPSGTTHAAYDGASPQHADGHAAYDADQVVSAAGHDSGGGSGHAHQPSSAGAHHAVGHAAYDPAHDLTAAQSGSTHAGADQTAAQLSNTHVGYDAAHVVSTSTQTGDKSHSDTASQVVTTHHPDSITHAQASHDGQMMAQIAASAHLDMHAG
jgi:hypothetical protein